MEGNGNIPNGWPLGLGNTNSRIRVVGVVAALQPAACRRPSSFASFSSSNLDTESTASFFREGSVSLGRLMGIERTRSRHCGIEGGNNVGDEKSRHVSVGTHNSNVDGFCAPLLHHVIGKIARNQITSTH